MNPTELIKERDTLRCQLHDAREQLARDSATIARVTAERDELIAHRNSDDTSAIGLLQDNVTLRARVAELEAALRELHWRFKDIPDGCDHSVGICWCSEIAALDKAAELLSASPALHPDTERLDWLEAQPSKYEWAVTLDHGCVFVTRNKTSGRPSIRAAIDTARASREVPSE